MRAGRANPPRGGHPPQRRAVVHYAGNTMVQVPERLSMSLPPTVAPIVDGVDLVAVPVDLKPLGGVFHPPAKAGGVLPFF